MHRASGRPRTHNSFALRASPAEGAGLCVSALRLEIWPSGRQLPARALHRKRAGAAVCAARRRQAGANVSQPEFNPLCRRQLNSLARAAHSWARASVVAIAAPPPALPPPSRARQPASGARAELVCSKPCSRAGLQSGHRRRRRRRRQTRQPT